MIQCANMPMCQLAAQCNDSAANWHIGILAHCHIIILFFRDKQQLIIDMEFKTSVRYQELITAFHNHDEGAFGKVHLFQCIGFFNHFLCYCDIPEIGINFFGQFYAKIISGFLKWSREIE